MFNRKKNRSSITVPVLLHVRVRFRSLNLLFADYAPARTSTVHTFRTSVGYHTSSSFAHPSSPSLQLPQSTQITSMSSLSHSASLPSPSPSSDVMTRIQTTHTRKFSHMGTRSLKTRPALCTSRSILPLTLNTEVESLLSVSSEEVTNQVIYTGIHTSSVTTGEPNYSEPSEVGFLIRKSCCFYQCKCE